MDNSYICMDEGREKYCTAYLHDSWIVANGWDRGVQDLDLMIISWYWASTTITSVGYGDILPGKHIIKCLLICIKFYSYTTLSTH